MKPCTRCGVTFPLRDFYKCRNGLTARCRHCLSAAAREWGQRPEVKARRRGRDKGRPRSRTPEQDRAYRLSKYGLDEESHAEILVAQGGRCAICKTDSPGARDWHIDHDHNCCPSTPTCGTCTRGILCGKCNSGIGLLRDDPVVVRAAADYLEFPALMQALGSAV